MAEKRSARPSILRPLDELTKERKAKLGWKAKYSDPFHAPIESTHRLVSDRFPPGVRDITEWNTEPQLAKEGPTIERRVNFGRPTTISEMRSDIGSTVPGKPRARPGPRMASPRPKGGLSRSAKVLTGLGGAAESFLLGLPIEVLEAYYKSRLVGAPKGTPENL